MSLQDPSLNTNKNTPYLHAERITVRREKIKNKAKNYDDVLFLQIKLLMDLNPLKNSSIIFNL
jgi:hypothetical protein